MAVAVIALPFFFPGGFGHVRQIICRVTDGAVRMGGGVALGDLEVLCRWRSQASRRGRAAGVRGTDISARSGGVVVTVRGDRPRAVLVLARYHGPRLE